MFAELSKLLSSPARLRIIKFFSFQPNNRYTAEEAGKALGMAKAAAEREMKALAVKGLLARKRHGKHTYYTYAVTHKQADALKRFLEETTVPDNRTIASAFRGLSGITLVIAGGVLAQDVRSPVDLLIIARRPKNPLIVRAVRKVETGVALPLRYAILDAGEFKGRLEANDRLLRDVFDFTHRVIVGRM